MTKPSLALILSAAFAVLLMDQTVALADLINGSFEVPDVGLTGVSEIHPGAEPAGFGWKVNAGTVEVAGELYPALPGPAYDGTQFLDLNGISIGTLSQEIATIPGDVYQVGFAYANNYVHTNETHPATAVVHVIDAMSGMDLLSPFSISHGNSTSTDLHWALSSASFVATGDSTILRFVSTTTDPLGGILLDGASLAPLSSVPEPSSLILMGTGFAAVGLARARRLGRAGTCIGH